MQKLKSMIILLGLIIGSTANGASSDLRDGYDTLKKSTNKKIALIETKLNKLNTKISRMRGETKGKAIEQYEEFRESKDDLKEQFIDLTEMSSEKWTLAKIKVKELADRLESKVDRAIE